MNLRITIDERINSDNTPGIYDMQGAKLEMQNRYDKAVQVHNAEKEGNWRMLEELFDTRITGYEVSAAESYNTANTYRPNTKFHSSFPAITLEAASSAMTSFVAPVKEQGIKIALPPNTIENLDYSGKIKDTISTYDKDLNNLFNNPDSQVHRNLNASLYNAYAYGNCANLSTFSGDDYKCVSLDFRSLVIDVDEYTNEITHIFRKRYNKKDNRVETDVWHRREGTVAGNISILDALKRPYAYTIYDESWNIVDSFGLNYMPVHYGRLRPVPGYRYGKGYGELIKEAAKDMHSFMNVYGDAALFALNPARIWNSVTVKDKAALQKRLVPGGLIQVEIGAPEIPIVALVPTADPNMMNAFMPYFQELQSTIRLAPMLEYLLLPEQVNMTDAQVRQRIEQKIMMISGTVMGIQSDLISPMIKTMLIKMIERNDQPWKEAKLQAVDTMITIKNGLDQARDLVRAQGNVQGAQYLMQLGLLQAQIDQATQGRDNVIDNLAFDKMARETAVLLGLDMQHIKSIEEIVALRTQRAEQQQDAQTGASLQALVQAAGQ